MFVSDDCFIAIQKFVSGRNPLSTVSNGRRSSHRIHATICPRKVYRCARGLARVVCLTTGAVSRRRIFALSFRLYNKWGRKPAGSPWEIAPPRLPLIRACTLMHPARQSMTSLRRFEGRGRREGTETAGTLTGKRLLLWGRLSRTFDDPGPPAVFGALDFYPVRRGRADDPAVSAVAARAATTCEAIRQRAGAGIGRSLDVA